MTAPAVELAASAHRVMAEYPSRSGWRRHEARPCGGEHRSASGLGGGLVYWRRPRELFDEAFGLLDPDVDPVLWVAEQVPPTLCCNDFFFWANSLTAVQELQVSPWSVSTSSPKAGATVRLDTANGSWIWQLIGQPDCRCGGWIARWPD